MVLSFHVRSNSFPSRQHPQAAHVDEQLNRLRSSETASSSSSSSICQILSNLHDLHDSLDKMFRLSISQQTLSQDQVEMILDWSIKILDLCTISEDDLSKMKESLKEIESILRRKRGDLSAEIKKYLASRKFLKKSFQKVLKNLKTGQNKNKESLAVFREAEAEQFLCLNLYSASCPDQSLVANGHWSQRWWARTKLHAKLKSMSLQEWTWSSNQRSPWR